MSPEERQLLAGLFDRVRSAAGAQRDREAETFIQDAVREQPYAPYLLAQTVIVQEQALRAANDRLHQLEAQVKNLEQQQGQQQPGSGGFLSGIGSLFGGGTPQTQPPPPPRSAVPPSGSPWGNTQGYSQPYPQQAPPQQAAPWGGGGQPQQQGGGFLKGALGAAAGVAGGVLLADSIRGLFGGHNNTLGIGSGFGGSGFGGMGDALGGSGRGETIVNNYYGNDSASQQAQDWQQDQDQDQDDAQDAADSGTDYASDDT